MKEPTDKESRLNAIAELKKQQLDLIKKATKIAMLPPGKRPSTAINRAFRVMRIAIECRLLQERIKLIMWQPIAPDFVKGGLILDGKPAQIKQNNKWKGSTFWRP